MLVPTFIGAKFGTNIYWCQGWYQHMFVPMLLPTQCWYQHNVHTNTTWVPTLLIQNNVVTNALLVPTQCCYKHKVCTNTMLVPKQCLFQHMLVPTYVGDNLRFYLYQGVLLSIIFSHVEDFLGRRPLSFLLFPQYQVGIKMQLYCESTGIALRIYWYCYFILMYWYFVENAMVLY